MATHIERIGIKARKSPSLVFTTSYHHLADIDNLRKCYGMLAADKAAGKDGVT